MSDQPQGDGWWVASDGKWYPPLSDDRYHFPKPEPDYTPPPRRPQPEWRYGWWVASDGKWYPPGLHPNYQPPPLPVPRPPASRMASLSMVALVIAGCGVVVGGAILADSTDREASAGFLPGILWLSWLVLVALALLGLFVWRTLAPDSVWIKVAAILGLIAAAALFPGWIYVLVGMGRGL